MTADVRRFLDDLDAAHQAATPGPWEHVVDDHGRKGIEHSVWSTSGECYAAEYIGNRPDAALIVAAVNALPALTSVLRQLADLADELETAAGLPTRSEFDRGVAAHQADLAARIRALLAPLAAPDSSRSAT